MATWLHVDPERNPPESVSAERLAYEQAMSEREDLDFDGRRELRQERRDEEADREHWEALER